ncbi:hypothetical protein ERICV_03206 [Paenibacillus larvae subsp. larvae]|uniref:Uncharacterized protein n=1 Tax=Paenibacillus larvae subsp. larvae TaxID=147375 RepID=A0A6C0QVE3_9BACL|nr:hypothetical protein ERICV_02039 [Paenibacillus larvae subsp. larvae]QHZ52318.1 hypothetical protein ERICV_03206 [Paenibacillus larvae subsp. larvae]
MLYGILKFAGIVALVVLLYTEAPHLVDALSNVPPIEFTPEEEASVSAGISSFITTMLLYR